MERYLKTKTGTKPQTKSNYRFVVNIQKNEPFSGKKIGAIKTSDAKLFLIKLQSDGRGLQHGQDGAWCPAPCFSDGGR